MKKIFLILTIALVLVPSSIKAADTYTLLEPLPCIEGVSIGCKAGQFQNEISMKDYLLYVYKFAIGLAVFLAIVMIIYGGFLYITSEVPFIKSEGKSKIENAVFGLVMILVSYLILLTIDPRLVDVNSEIPAIPTNYVAQREWIDYQAQLSGNLELSSNTDLAKIKSSRGIINSKVARTKAVEDEYRDLKIDRGAYDLDIARINAEVRSAEIDIIMTKARLAGISTYSIYLTSINYSDGGKEDSKRISDIYDYAINKLATDTPGAVEETRILGAQKIFMVEQIKEDQDLKFSVAKNTYGLKIPTKVIPGTPIPIVIGDNDNSKELNEKLKNYQSKLAGSPELAKLVGLRADQYSKIYQARIDTINQTLQK